MRWWRRAVVSVAAVAIVASVAAGASWLESAPPEPVCRDVLAPNTLTPEDRLALGIKHLVANLDPQNGYLPFFHTAVEGGGIVSEHSGWDFVDISARYLEALWLARRATGDSAGFDEELALRKTLLSFMGPDGLFYRQRSEFYPYREAHTADQASALRFLLAVYRDTRSKEVARIIRRTIAALEARAERTKSGFRFGCPTYAADGGCGGGASLFHDDPIQFSARLARTVEDFSLLVPESGRAGRFAEGLLRYIGYESGVFADERGFDGQTHSRLNALIGLFELARKTGDEGLAERVKEQVRFLFGTYAGFGWVPEVIDRGNPRNPHAAWSETCAVVDLLELVMMLARDEPLFWEMADRIVRNQLAEAQFYREDELPPQAGGRDRYRLLGSFCGYCRVNSWNRRTMNCCSASGVRGWALVWENAVTKDSRGVWINLSLNHETGDVVVMSERPHRGRVAVESKRAGTFYLRIPVWVLRKDVRVNGSPYRGRWERRWYMVFEARGAGERWLVSYPLPSRKTYFRLGGKEYTVSWKGNTVVSIEPEPDVFPTYDRGHLALKSFRLVRKRLCWLPSGEGGAGE